MTTQQFDLTIKVNLTIEADADWLEGLRVADETPEQFLARITEEIEGEEWSDIASKFGADRAWVAFVEGISEVTKI